MRNPLKPDWRKLFGRNTKPVEFRTTLSPLDMQSIMRMEAKEPKPQTPKRRWSDRFK
jgi:hypothetical protein